MIKEYSKIGEYHIANHKKSEDYLLSEDNENMMFLCLADGVSSCENSLQGAKAISNKVKDIVAHIDLFHFDEEVIKKLVIDELQYSLRQISQNENKISPMKEDIILNLDTKGLEVGTKFAIFESVTKLSEDSNTNQSETTTEKI